MPRSPRRGGWPIGWIGLSLLILNAWSVCDLHADETRLRELWRHRNLGQAHFETPGQAEQAVEELRAALALDPGSAVEHYNLGIALLAAGRTDEGIEQLQAAQRADPSLPHTWYRLGLAYEQAGRLDEAIDQLSGLLSRRRDDAAAHFRLGLLRLASGERDMARDHLEAAALLDPMWAAPHFHLSGFHQTAQRAVEAEEEMAIFRSLEEQGHGAQVDGEPMAHPLAGFYEELDARHAIVDGAAVDRLTFEAQTLARDLHEASALLRLMDVDGDGGSDLWAVTAYSVALFADGATLRATGLEGQSMGIRDLAAGDFDHDGLLDLCLLGDVGSGLWRNIGGDFERTSQTLPSGSYDVCQWLDYDHDGYLDLMLLGTDSALLHNRGDGSFVDRTAGFPFVQGWGESAAVLGRPFDGGGTDLVVTYRERRGVLYRDLVAGTFEPKALLNVPLALGSVRVADINNDGYFDLAAGNPSMAVLFLNDLVAGFRRATTPPSAIGPVFFADLAGRGVVDLVAGGLVFPNRGLGRLGQGRALDGWPRLVHASLAADFDRDGRLDVAAVGDGGRLVRLRNVSSQGKAVRLQLTAARSLVGTVVEVRVGAHHQQQMVAATPLDFALGDAQRADWVRVRWPDGSRVYVVDVEAGTQLHLEGPAVERRSFPALETEDAVVEPELEGPPEPTELPIALETGADGEALDDGTGSG